MFLSSVDQILDHPNYNFIIEFGEIAIPALLTRLQNNPSFLTEALYIIVDKSNYSLPTIHPNAHGDVNQLTDIWINWGKINGYI